MKYLFLTAIFLTASCGKYEYSGASGSLGEVLPLNTGFVSDTTTLTRICDALGRKSPSQLANSTHTFSTIQTDCNGTNATGGELVPTRIQGSSGIYYFKRQDNGMDFLFPDVDTQSNGVMSSVCTALSSGQAVPSMTILPSGEAQTVATSGFTSADCVSNGNELCVYFQTASQDSSGSYVVHTKEWVRFKVNQSEAKVGFYAYRKKLTKSYCPQNQSVTYQATLK